MTIDDKFLEKNGMLDKENKCKTQKILSVGSYKVPYCFDNVKECPYISQLRLSDEELEDLNYCYLCKRPTK